MRETSKFPRCLTSHDKTRSWDEWEKGRREREGRGVVVWILSEQRCSSSMLPVTPGIFFGSEGVFHLRHMDLHFGKFNPERCGCTHSWQVNKEIIKKNFFFTILWFWNHMFMTLQTSSHECEKSK